MQSKLGTAGGRHAAKAGGSLHAALTASNGFSASAIALAVALLAGAPQMARAASECGADGAGQDTLTCSGTSYPSGITYTLSNGLTLNLDHPNMVVSGSGVALSTPVGPVGATLHVNVVNIDSITTTGAASAVFVSHNGTDGLAAATINGGTLTSTGTATTVSVVGNAGNRTGALLTMNGGQVASTGTGGGMTATAGGVNGKADAIIAINGGSVSAAAGTAVQAYANGPNHVGTARITMHAGAVLSGAADGLWARNSGKGLAQVQMTGGKV